MSVHGDVVRQFGCTARRHVASQHRFDLSAHINQSCTLHSARSHLLMREQIDVMTQWRRRVHVRVEAATEMSTRNALRCRLYVCVSVGHVANTAAANEPV